MRFKMQREKCTFVLSNFDWCKGAVQWRGWVKTPQSGTLDLGAEKSSVHKEAVVRSFHFWRPRDRKECGWIWELERRFLWLGARWGGQWAWALSRKVVEPVDSVGLWRAVRAIAEFDVSGLWSVVIFTFLKEPSSLQSRKQGRAGRAAGGGGVSCGRVRDEKQSSCGRTLSRVWDEICLQSPSTTPLKSQLLYWKWCTFST